MRVFSLGVALCAMTTQAFAGPQDYYADDYYGSQASFYMSYSFDSPPPKLDQAPAAALRYGFQLDHDRRDYLGVNTHQAPLLKWEFSDMGFDNISVAGTPLISQQMILRQDDEEGGGFFGYVKDNIGPIILGTGVAILAFAIVDGDKDSRNRDPSDPDGIGTENDGAMVPQ